MLRPYQKRGVAFLSKNNGGALFLPPGAGKTIITLTFFDRWLRKNKNKPILLIAPLGVMYDAWEYEPKQNFPNLKICNIHKTGYLPGHQIYLINPERFVIDIKHNEKYLRLMRGVCVDESTMFKNCFSGYNGKVNRTQNFHRYIDVINPIMRLILTGTPITRNLLDIYGQYYLIDKWALGGNFNIYRSEFFEPMPDGRSWMAKEGTVDRIVKILSKKSFILTPKEEKQIGYPKVLESDLYFRLSPRIQKKYNKLHKDFILEVAGHTIDKTQHKGKIYSGAVNYGYCTQFTSGNMYEAITKLIPDPKNPSKMIIKKIGNKINYIHKERLNVLSHLIDTLQGDPLFVLYQHSSDLDMFKRIKVKNSEIIKGGMTVTQKASIISRWNSGKITVLYAQIKTVSHGLNLQFGGSNVCFYTMPDDYELYNQAFKRVARPGQKAAQVTVNRIIARNTVDEIQRLQILNRKTFTADQFNKKLREIA